MKKIILAGGCFWGVEAYFQRLKGITETTVGYTDAAGKNPTYHDVCMSSGHVEAVLIVYNETLISITKVLEHFFRIINPTEVDQQGHDIGVQYRNAIFFFDPGDVPAIQAILRNEQSRYVKKLATVVKPAGVFWPAEDYHQDYLVKNPSGYCHVNMRLAKPEELK